MTESYKYADVRFNSGNGALLCNDCSIIIAYGFEHEDKLHFCDKCQPFAKVTRVEVIGPDGREYVRYFEPEEFMHYMLQDDERTLKIFIEDEK